MPPMPDAERTYTILLADDDLDDCGLVADALTDLDDSCESCVVLDLRMVHDGEQLLDYMYRREQFSDPATSPRPDLVLLDLNMPRKDGREALRELKADPLWARLRVVVLTTSTADDDVNICYDAGAASFLAKPTTYAAWIELLGRVSQYWFQTALLPPRH